MAKEEKVEVEGEVLEALGGGMFRVARRRSRADRLHGRQDAPLPDPHGAGRPYQRPGLAYDLTRGRIVYRHK